jgi:hypothetical protein
MKGIRTQGFLFERFFGFVENQTAMSQVLVQLNDVKKLLKLDLAEQNKCSEEGYRLRQPSVMKL